MFMMLFLLAFNQSALWTMKDALVVTTSGAEVIPFIKVWAILPSAVLFAFLFTFLSRRYRQETVFSLLTGSFLFFYAFFIFVAYPHREHLQLVQTSAYLTALLPSGSEGLVSMFRHWSFTLFYVTCELWSTFIISVLFWNLANETTSLSQARRFYGSLGIAANLAIIAAGLAFACLHRLESVLPSFSQAGKGEKAMIFMTLLIIINGSIAIWLFRRQRQATYSLEDTQSNAFSSKQDKEKLTLRQSLVHVGKSKYLLCIAVIVISYSLVINLAEIVWKDQLRSLYPQAADYNLYLSYLQMIQGALALLLAACMPYLLKKLEWMYTALLTPVMMLICSMVSFTFLPFLDVLEPYSALIGLSPLAILTFVNSIQNCLSKACKYSLFDSTKEMALIPLSADSRIKGKTAIDGIGVRLGKSGGSLIHQGLLLYFTTIAAGAPYVGVVLLAVIAVWIAAVCTLGKDKTFESKVS